MRQNRIVRSSSVIFVIKRDTSSISAQENLKMRTRRHSRIVIDQITRLRLAQNKLKNSISRNA